MFRLPHMMRFDSGNKDTNNMAVISNILICIELTLNILCQSVARQ